MTSLIICVFRTGIHDTHHCQDLSHGCQSLAQIAEHEDSLLQGLCSRIPRPYVTSLSHPREPVVRLLPWALLVLEAQVLACYVLDIGDSDYLEIPPRDDHCHEEQCTTLIAACNSSLNGNYWQHVRVGIGIGILFEGRRV